MMDLPAEATQESRIRYDVARELAQSCPAELGREIALTGSVARGIADNDSDIELNLWVPKLPDPDVWRRWLDGVGATDVSPDAVMNRLDDSVWVTCRYRNVWIELGWGTTDAFGALIDQVARGSITGLGKLQFADTILKAVTLRTEGEIDRWQRSLANYPDTLRTAIIANNTAVWSDPHVPGVRWALAARDERFVLAMRLLWDMENILAVLYALNRTWQPDVKWTNLLVRELPIRPDRLPERINAIFTLRDPRASIVECFTLIVETLELVPAPYDVSRALASVRASLESEGFRPTSREQR